MSGRSLALYVHLPWCVRKCPYCDFNSHQLKSGVPDSGYIEALIQDFDAELPSIRERRVDSVFFGGGTPSLFAPDDFAHLLQELRRRIAFAGDAEITLEANPGTIERGRFVGYRDAGINRVSLGAQSFHAPALRRLGRIHTAADTHRAVAELRAAGIENFNLDLMYALPQQSLEEALFDVQSAIALAPAHVSYYQLTLEPGTVFHARPPILPDDDAAWLIQTQCHGLLQTAGYRQYEISAFARAGRECRHNLNYWTFGDYVGVGAGAHGKLSLSLPGNIVRSEKPKQPRDFMDHVIHPERGIGVRNVVKIGDLPFEFMLNALRLNDGFSIARFESQTGLSAATLGPSMAAAVKRGLVESTDSGWKASDLGRRFLNDAVSSFLT